MTGPDCLPCSNCCTLTHLYYVYLFFLQVNGHLALHPLGFGIIFNLLDDGFISSKLIYWTYSTLHQFYCRKRLRHGNSYMIVSCLCWEFLRIPAIFFLGNSVIHHYQNPMLSLFFYFFFKIAHTQTNIVRNCHAGRQHN